MSNQLSPTTSKSALEPPKKSVEIEDPGAHELASENEEDHFSDASEGRQATARGTGSGSPIPTTRVERVDDSPSHGEVPGTAAYNIRTQDAIPDAVEIVPEGSHSRSSSRGRVADSPSTPGGGPIPKTVVEKVDPSSPSHGDVPGTEAHQIRKADAVPDVVLKAPKDDDGAAAKSPSGHTPGDLPIPSTVISKVDSKPSHGEVPGTDAHAIRQSDAKPDAVEETGDAEGKQIASLAATSSERLTESGSPTLSMSRSNIKPHQQRGESVTPQLESSSCLPIDLPVDIGGGLGEYNEDKDGQGAGEGFGEDFDDFEEGGEEDEFGDFDEGFQSPVVAGGVATESTPQILATTAPLFPVLDYDKLSNPDEMLAATEPYINELFPKSSELEAQPPDPLPKDSSVFLTERSLSLWSQLVAPPPLQPPNWLRSRIRRLFLVSLGVPVDLDEILPASKQKKLVLPSIHLSSESRSPRPSYDGRATGSVAKLKRENDSSASVNSTSSSSNRRRKGPPPPPDIDILSARILCATTDVAMGNLTEEDLKSHVKELRALMDRAGEVLEYWLKRKDGAVGDKEAFEGVIENLVKHARKLGASIRLVFTSKVLPLTASLIPAILDLLASPRYTIISGALGSNDRLLSAGYNILNMRSTSGCPLLNLPREIRDMIQRYLLMSVPGEPTGDIVPRSLIVVRPVECFAAFLGDHRKDRQIGHRRDIERRFQELPQLLTEAEIRAFMARHNIPQIYTKRVWERDGDKPRAWLIPECRIRFRQRWHYGSYLSATDFRASSFQIHWIPEGCETSYEVKNPAIWPSTLFVNVQLHDEGQQILYGNNCFSFDNDTINTFIPFMQDRSAKARAIIRYLSFSLHLGHVGEDDWDRVCRYITKNLNIRSLRLCLNTDDTKSSCDWGIWPIFRGLVSTWPRDPYIKSSLQITRLKQLELVTQWGGELRYDRTVADVLVKYLEDNFPGVKIKSFPSRSHCYATLDRTIPYPPERFFK
ncbi:MAG: hypothetical protein M1812_003608 [Candelaria pacifica]|nr:MAG: hypothetical protein M1812_003608 [Candelaria pacifica]